MARRYFNWTLAIVLVVAVVVFAGAVFALHRWQKGKGAEHALPLGERAYAEQNWDEAAKQFGQYLELRRDDVPVLQKYADAQLKRRPRTMGHVDLAIAAYRSILRQNVGNAEVTKQLVGLLIARSYPLEAGQIASEYLREPNRDDPELRRLLASALSEQREYAQAAKTLMDLIKDHPDDVPAYERLGWLAQQHPTDVNAPASDWFEKAVAANPQSAMAYTIRGEFRRASRRSADALADFEQAAKCDLSNADTHLRLAQELILVQAFDRAKEHLKALQAEIPKKDSLWQIWAAAVLSSGTAQEKVAIAESGLNELAAYPWDFLPTATELFATANRPVDANDCVSKMRKRGLQPSLLTFLDGLVAASKGNLRDAVKSWQDALGQGVKVYAYAGGFGPKVPVRLMLASTYTQLGDIQSASVQLQTLITEEPTSIDGRLALARLMIRMRDWTGAQEQAREVQRLSPGSAEAVLLEMQSRIFLLGGADASTPNREQAWDAIVKQLKQIDERLADKAQPEAVQIRLLLAQALSGQGKSAEAIKLLEDLRTQSPTDLRATLLEVEVLAGQKKSTEAIALLRGAIEQFPQAVEPVQNFVRLNWQEDPRQCESVIQQAIARIQQPEGQRDLGLLLAALYRFESKNDDLYGWLTKMASQFPNDIQIKRQLLSCETVAQDAQKAQSLVDQIKSLEGDAGWQWRYEQARTWLNPAVIADPNVFRAQYYARTTELLQKNLLANPNDQASRFLLATAHERAGQQQLALSAYREAYSRTPDNIVVIRAYIAALERNGTPADLAEADRVLKEASDKQLYHPDLEKYELQSQLRGQVRRGDLNAASDTLKQLALAEKEPNDITASMSLARISMQQGKFDEAEAILKELQTKATPRSLLPIAQARVQLQMHRGNTQEAVRLCDEAVQNTSQAADAYLLRAWTYASLGERDKAAEDFARALAKNPNDARILVSRARFYRATGRRDETIQDVRKALNLSVGDASVLKIAVPLCVWCGSPRLMQDAEAAVDKAQAAKPTNSELKLLKAQFLLGRGTKSSVEQGQRLLQEATTAEPQLSAAWHLLGRSELSQDQPGRALDTALLGLSHNERNRDLLLLKADAEAARAPRLAVSTLQDLLKQDSNDIEVESRLATALYKSGDKNQGRSILEARMKTDPNNPIPPATLAGLLGSDGRWTDVTEVVTKWVAKHPGDNYVVSTVALVLLNLGNPEAAKIAENPLKAAVERNPKSVPAVSALAMLVQSQGRSEEAAALNRKVLDLDPNNVIALNNLAWILCEQEKYAEALELATRGLKVAPDYVDLLDTRGVIFYQQKKYKEAAEDFGRCVSLYPVNARALATAYFHLARAYDKLQRAAEAQDAINKAMDLHNRASDKAKPLSSGDLAEAKLLDERLRK